MTQRIEDLQCNDLKIVQDDALYTFSSDSVVLANYVKTKSNDKCVEIGAGSGVISILVDAKNKLKKIYAFEIQKQMADLSEQNLELNHLTEKIKIVNDDIKNFEKYIKKGEIDVVFSNPPYFKVTNFEQSETRKIAREEVCLSCKELTKNASEMLKFGGSFFCCYSAERACELICNCQANNLTVKEMFFTENGKNEVKLVVVKCVKGGKNGCKVLPNLVTNDKNGDYIEKLKTKNFLKQN